MEKKNYEEPIIEIINVDKEILLSTSIEVDISDLK